MEQELNSLDGASEYLQAVTHQFELKFALQKAQKRLEKANEAFEISRTGMPEYIDYQVALEAYNQSKLDHTTAYKVFEENTFHRLQNSIGISHQVNVVEGRDS